ncbi:hypothetical protein GCM10009528_32000 [Kineococcus aurantiacus]
MVAAVSFSSGVSSVIRWDGWIAATYLGGTGRDLEGLDGPAVGHPSGPTGGRAVSGAAAAAGARRTPAGDRTGEGTVPSPPARGSRR